MNDINKVRELAGRGGLPDIWRDEVYNLLDEIVRLRDDVDTWRKTAKALGRRLGEEKRELNRLQTILDGIETKLSNARTA